MQRHRLLLIPVFFLSCLAACGDDNDASPQTDAASDANAQDASDASDSPDSATSDPISVQYTLAEGAVVLEGALLTGLQSVSAETTILTFAADTPGVETLVAGTVVVTGISDVTPQGLLRRIVAVQNDSDTIELTTEPAAISAAFHSLDIQAQLELPDGAIEWTVDASTPSSQKDSIGFGGPFNWVVFDGDDDVSTDEDQVRVHGEISASASWNFGLSYDLGALDDILSLDFPPDLDPTDIDLAIGLGASAEAVLDLTLEGRASLGFQKEVELGRQYLSPVGAGPIVFIPVVRAVAEIEGNVPGSFIIQTGQEAGFSAGVSFSIDDGFVSNLQPPYFNSLPSSADVELGADARASVTIELDFLLYGIVGPSAGLTAYAGAEANVFSDPCWRAFAGVEAFIGLYVEFLTVELVDYKYPFPVEEVDIATGSCTTAEQTDPQPASARAWIEAASVIPTSETSHMMISQAIDGNFLLSGLGANSLIKVRNDGSFVWARSFIEHAVLDTPVATNTHMTRPDGGITVAAARGLVLQLDAAGHLQDVYRVQTGSEDDTIPSAIVSDNAGGFWISTTQAEGDSQPSNVAMVHIAADGTMRGWQWGDTGAYEIPHALTWYEGDLYQVVVQRDFDRDPSTVTWLLRWSADGGLLDAVLLSDCTTFEELSVRSLVVSEDGKLVFAGSRRFTGPRAVIGALNPDLTVAWASSIGTNSLLGLEITDIEQLDSGAYLVGGNRLYAAPDDAFVARTDSVGRFLWMQRFGGTSWESGTDVHVLPDGSAMALTGTETLGDLESSLLLSIFDVRTGEVPYGAASGITSGPESWDNEDTCIDATVRTDLAALPLNVVREEVDVDEVAFPAREVQLTP
jgi:hypothetical protein